MPAIGRPKGRTQANSLREPIIAKACEIFGEGGYDAASLRAVAEAVGITGPAIYNHFASKAELLFACLETSLVEMVDVGERAISRAADDPLERFKRFVYENARFQLRSASLQSVYELVLYGDGRRAGILTAEQEKRLKTLQRCHLDNLRRLLADGAETGQFHLIDINTTAFSLFALGEHLSNWARVRDGQREDELCRKILQLSLRMVGWPFGNGR